jgi:ATP-dependent Clp protease ATP-binding subunit ClpC
MTQKNRDVDPSGAGKRKKKPPENGIKSILPQVGLDVTALAKEGKLEEIAGWDEKIDRLEEIVQRRIKHHAVLLGPEGAGKRSIIFGLAERIASGKTTSKLSKCRIVELNLASIAQIAREPEHFPRVLFAALQEALQQDGYFVAAIRDFHVLLEGPPGTPASLTAAPVLRAMMEQTPLAFVLSTTEDSFSYLKLSHKWIPDLAEIVEVGEPSDEVLRNILTAVSDDLGKHHGIVFRAESIELAAEMAKRFSENRPVSGFAVRLLDEAAAKIAIGSAKTNGAVEVTADDIASACARRTGLPLSKVMRSETLELLELEDILEERVKGQSEAITRVAGFVRVASLGLEDRGLRPAGVLMFVGPSGVGKTELARALTETRYGSESRLSVINMAQYADEKAFQRLLGSTEEGDPGGILLKTIETNPHSVLILKEIENSNAAVAAVLSEFFRRGILYTPDGREVSFPNGIVILTVTIENLLGEFHNGVVPLDHSH